MTCVARIDQVPCAAIRQVAGMESDKKNQSGMQQTITGNEGAGPGVSRMFEGEV